MTIIILVLIIIFSGTVVFYPRYLSKIISKAFSQDTKRLADNSEKFAEEVKNLTENQKRMIDGYFHSIEIYLKETSSILEKLKERDEIIATAISDGNVKLGAFLETLREEKNK